MPTYTKQDVLDKIDDISTNLHSCFTQLEAKGVTVPADSSLDDLATLIGQIPDANRPDYDLPWVMVDGSTFFTLSDTLQRTRSFFTDIELAPSAGVIWGCRSTNSNQGSSSLYLNYTDTSVYSYRRLIKSLGTASQTGDVNNYAQKAWSGYPFYKKQRLAASYLDTSTYRASVQYNGSWTTAGSSMAQASGSQLTDMIQTVFARTTFSATGMSIDSICPAGTKVYWIGLTSGNKDTSTMQHEYVPILHWDISTGKYQPCFMKASNRNLGSYPKSTKSGWADGTAYYIDVTQGLTEKTGYSSGTACAYTDIPNSSTYRYVFKVAAERRNSGSTVDYMTAYDTSNGYSMRIGNNFTTSNYTRFVKSEQYGGANYNTYTGSVGNTSVEHFLGVDFANKSMFEVMNTLTANQSTYTITVPDAPDSARGKLCIYKPHSSTYKDALYSVMIYEGDALIHYLVWCGKSGATYGVFYDCVTKKTYSISIP